MESEVVPICLLLTAMAKTGVGHRPCFSPLRPGLSWHSVTVLCFLAAVCTLTAGGSGTTPNNTLRMTSSKWAYVVGSNVTVNCVLNASAAVNVSARDIRWDREDGAALTADARVQVLGPSTSQLRLMDVQFSDSATYRCGLDSQDGGLSASQRIDVGSPPSKATDLKCHSNNFVTVVCSWTEGRVTNPATEYQLLEHRLDGEVVVCQRSSCNQTEWDLFEYTVKASNALGSEQTAKVQFQATTDAVPNPPIILKVKTLSKSSLEVTWRPPTEVSLRYLREMKYEAKWELQDISADSASQRVEFQKDRDIANQRFTITNLTRAYAYYQVSMRGHIHSWSKWSKPVINRTRETAPDPGHKLDLDCLPLNSTHQESSRDVQLSWVAFPEVKANGRLQYIINVNGTVYIAAQNISTYIIKDLDRNENYHISILARNLVGTSTESTCTVKVQMRKTPSVSALVSSIVSFLAICLLLALSHRCYKWIKKSSIDIPDIRLPHPIQTGNLTLGGNRCHPLNQEAESFDNFMETGLSVDLSPETDTFPACCKGSLSQEPILGLLDHGGGSPRKPNHAGGRPRLDAEKHAERGTEQEALLSPCLRGHWMDSTLSIGSGGSYMYLRDEHEAGYRGTSGQEPGPRGNGDCRGSLEGLVGGQETAADGWGLAESAWPQEAARLTGPDEPSGLLPNGSARGTPVLSGGKEEEDWLPMGTYRENACDYMNMKGGGCPKEKTWTVNHCADVPRVYPEPPGKLPADGDRCPGHPGKKEPPGDIAAPGEEECGEIANYVQQSFSRPLMPGRSSPGCDSPRPGRGKAARSPHAHQEGPAASRQGQTALRAGGLSPARRTASPEPGSGMDSRTGRLGCVGSEPASAGCPRRTEPTPDGSGVTIGDFTSSPPTPLDKRDWGKLECPAREAGRRPVSGETMVCPVANANDPYVTMCQLPAVASGAANGDCSDYVTQDQLLRGMGSHSPALARTQFPPEAEQEEEEEEGGEAPLEVATTGLTPKEPAAPASSAVLNGHPVPSLSPRLDPRDSGYVTHDDLARMATTAPQPTDSKPPRLTQTAPLT